MTAYTRESPFEFEGVKVWRSPLRVITYDWVSGTIGNNVSDALAHAAHAFIEAERDTADLGRFTQRHRTADGWIAWGAVDGVTEIPQSLRDCIAPERDTWAWTKDDRSEARRGRWVVRLSRTFARIGHDDFPGQWYSDETAHVGGAIFVRQAHKMRVEFREWQSTQTPPPPAVPAVGDYIRAVLRNGSVEEFEVARVDRRSSFWQITKGADAFFLHDSGPDRWHRTDRDILSWSPAERPTPAWHTPEPGSHWMLTINARAHEYVAVTNGVGCLYFKSVKYAGMIPLDEPRITAGREVTR